MAELRSFFQESREAILNLGGEPLKVWFNPSRISVNDFIRLQGLEDADVIVSGGDMATILMHTLVSWDLTHEGAPVSIDMETLRDLPPIFLGAVLSGLMEELSPKAPEGSTSTASPNSSASASPTPPSGSEAGSPATPAQRAPRSSRSTR